MTKHRRRQALSVTVEPRVLDGLERHARDQQISISRTVERSVHFTFALAPHLEAWIDALRSEELDDATRADMLARMEAALRSFRGII